MIPKNKVLDLFDARFDYASARIVLADVLAKAGVSAAKDGLDADDVRRLVAAIGALGLSRVDALVAGLDALAAAAPAGKGKAAPAPEPEPEPAAEEAPAEDPADDADEGPKGKPGKGKKR